MSLPAISNPGNQVAAQPNADAKAEITQSVGGAAGRRQSDAGAKTLGALKPEPPDDGIFRPSPRSPDNKNGDRKERKEEVRDAEEAHAAPHAGKALPAIPRQQRLDGLFEECRQELEKTGVLNLAGCHDPDTLKHTLTRIAKTALPPNGITTIKLPPDISEGGHLDFRAIAELLKGLGARNKAMTVVIPYPNESVNDIYATGLGNVRVRLVPASARVGNLTVHVDNMKVLEVPGKAWSWRTGKMRAHQFLDIPGKTPPGAPTDEAIKAALADLMKRLPAIEQARGTRITPPNRRLLQAMFLSAAASRHANRQGMRIDYKSGAVQGPMDCSNDGLVLDLSNFPKSSVMNCGLGIPELAASFRECLQKAHGDRSIEINGVICPERIDGVTLGVSHLIAGNKKRTYIEVSPPAGGGGVVDLRKLPPEVQIQLRNVESRQAEWTLWTAKGAAVVPDRWIPDGVPVNVQEGDGPARPLVNPPKPLAVRYPSGLLVLGPPWSSPAAKDAKATPVKSSSTQPEPWALEEIFLLPPEQGSEASRKALPSPERKEQIGHEPARLSPIAQFAAPYIEPWDDRGRSDALAWKEISTSPVWREQHAREMVMGKAQARGIDVRGVALPDNGRFASEYSLFMKWSGEQSDVAPEVAFEDFRKQAELLLAEPESKEARSAARIPAGVREAVGALLAAEPTQFDKSAQARAKAALWKVVEARYPIPQDVVGQRAEAVQKHIDVLKGLGGKLELQDALLQSLAHLIAEPLSRSADADIRAAKFLERAHSDKPLTDLRVIRSLGVIGYGLGHGHAFSNENYRAAEAIGILLFGAVPLTFTTFGAVYRQFFAAGAPEEVNLSSEVNALLAVVSKEELFDPERAMVALALAAKTLLQSDALGGLGERNRAPIHDLAARLPSARQSGTEGTLREKAAHILLGIDPKARNKPKLADQPHDTLYWEVLDFLQSSPASHEQQALTWWAKNGGDPFVRVVADARVDAQQSNNNSPLADFVARWKKLKWDPATGQPTSPLGQLKYALMVGPLHESVAGLRDEMLENLNLERLPALRAQMAWDLAWQESALVDTPPWRRAHPPESQGRSSQRSSMSPAQIDSKAPPGKGFQAPPLEPANGPRTQSADILAFAKTAVEWHTSVWSDPETARRLSPHLRKIAKTLQSEGEDIHSAYLNFIHRVGIAGSDALGRRKRKDMSAEDYQNAVAAASGVLSKPLQDRIQSVAGVGDALTEVLPGHVRGLVESYVAPGASPGPAERAAILACITMELSHAVVTEGRRHVDVDDLGEFDERSLGLQMPDWLGPPPIPEDEVPESKIDMASGAAIRPPGAEPILEPEADRSIAGPRPPNLHDKPRSNIPAWWSPLDSAIRKTIRDTSSVFSRKSDAEKALHDFHKLWRTKLSYAVPWAPSQPDPDTLKVVLLSAPDSPELLSDELRERILELVDDKDTPAEDLSSLVLSILHELTYRLDSTAPRPSWSLLPLEEADPAPIKRLDAKGAPGAAATAPSLGEFDREALSWSGNQWERQGGDIVFVAKKNMRGQNIHARFSAFEEEASQLENAAVSTASKRTADLKHALKALGLSMSQSLHDEIQALQKMDVIPVDRQKSILARCRYEFSYRVVTSKEMAEELLENVARDPDHAPPPLVVIKPSWM